jgi:hypothetical protein
LKKSHFLTVSFLKNLRIAQRSLKICHGLLLSKVLLFYLNVAKVHFLVVLATNAINKSCRGHPLY